MDAAKVPVTLRAASMVTVHVPMPVHAPLQPAKLEPVAGAAVNVTGVAKVNSRLQISPLPLGELTAAPVQLIPDGEEVMVPWPAPAFATVKA